MQQKDRKPIQLAVLLFSILAIMAVYRSNVITPRSINIIQFKGASSFIIQRLSLSRSLFEGANLSHSPDELLNAVKQFYISNTPVEQEIGSELKQLFGKEFLTDAYEIKP